MGGKRYAGARRRDRLRLKKGRWGERALARGLAVILIISAAAYVVNKLAGPGKKVEAPLEAVAAFQIPIKTLRELFYLSKKYDVYFPELLTLYSVENGFYPAKTVSPVLADLERQFIFNYEKIKGQYSEKELAPYYGVIAGILEDMKRFPVYDPAVTAAEAQTTSGAGYMYGDSWGGERAEQGGGTDIYDRENLRGRLHVLSATDGMVEKIGWNEAGGYHMGIRAPSGSYYYYAYFDSFADELALGARITAGQLLGYMGASGGPGSLSQVRLRFGISPATSLKRDFWINPYAFLRFLEESGQWLALAAS
jgi:murein DD-endopeptidase MepM/ murein hydrolase activator NlpD